MNIAFSGGAAASVGMPLSDKRTQLIDEIHNLEGGLQAYSMHHREHQTYLSGVLLPKIGCDADGISTRIAKHFQQLSRDKLEQPFVLLNERGLYLYWNKPEDAGMFYNFLRAQALPACLIDSYLLDGDVPETMKTLPVVQRYQGGGTQAVHIPHLYVEKFLALAQYHSYSLKPVVNDWYAARKLNRAKLVTAEAMAYQQSTETKPLEIVLVSATRVSLNAQEDLVKIDITASVAPVAAQPAHVVVLFDDSGSMMGHKIQAANQALKKFVIDLSPDALVSIQPFNAKTVAFRRTAAELQAEVQACLLVGKGNPAWCSIPANGNTPLIEALANSAVFLRQHPTDLTISDEVIRNTTIVLLTDGQPSKGSAEEAVPAMQTTCGLGHDLLSAVKVPGVTEGNYLSYGLKGFACRVLPVVFPIAISTDSDAVFVQNLATQLHMPQAFVSTGDNIQQEIDAAMGILSHMLVRVPQAFIGLHYQSQDVNMAVGVEEHNIFHGRPRTVYLTIPRDAQQLNLCLTVGESMRVVAARDRFPQVAISDPAQTRAIVGEYVNYRFMEIKVDYSNAIQVVVAGKHTNHEPRGGWSSPSLAEKAKHENLANEKSANEKFAAVKGTAVDNARRLLAVSGDAITKRDIELFISTVEGCVAIQDAVGGINLSRGDVAHYTQSRMVGAYAAPTVSVAPVRSGVFDNIRRCNFQGAQQELTADLSLVNSVSPDQYRATPLITAMVMLNDNRENQQLLPTIRNFVQFLFNQSGLDVTVQDASGNTALHRAAWFGLFFECKAILEIARARHQLAALKRCVNRATMGGNTGETVLDNIRRSEHLTEDQRKELIRWCGDAFVVANYAAITSAAELNSHSEPYWNTPIMDLLRDVRGCADVQFATQKRAYIIRLLDIPGIDLLESNFAGDTALHYAVWYGEFEIAEKIIQKTSGADKPLLFAARNTVALTKDSGGEVPHMNLVLVGKRVLVNFILSPNPDTHALLTQWLGLYNTFSHNVDLSQAAELTHLMQVYGKELQGYNPGTFLEAAPSNQFHKLMAACESLRLPQSVYTAGVDRLLWQLSAVRQNFSEKAIDDILVELQQHITAGGMSSLSMTSAFANPMVDLYRRACEFLTRLKDYVTGKSATLVPMVAAGAFAWGAQNGGSFGSMFAPSAPVAFPAVQGSGFGGAGMFAPPAPVAFPAVQGSGFGGASMFAPSAPVNQPLDVGCCYVDRIERLHDGYKVHGRNLEGDSRFIMMRDNGCVEGCSGSIRGFVEQQFYSCRVEIFRHFGVDLPKQHALRGAAPTR